MSQRPTSSHWMSTPVLPFRSARARSPCSVTVMPASMSMPASMLCHRRGGRAANGKMQSETCTFCAGWHRRRTRAEGRA
eukprot:scaffold85475_cov54-Phaeocystis_antarctica.AAC.3